MFKVTIPKSRPQINLFKLRLRLIVYATGNTKLIQAKKFIINPIIPLFEVVNICKNGTAKHMANEYTGLRIPAARTKKTSLISYFRNGTDGNKGISIKSTLVYAIAINKAANTNLLTARERSSRILIKTPLKTSASKKSNNGKQLNVFSHPDFNCRFRNYTESMANHSWTITTGKEFHLSLKTQCLLLNLSVL